MEGCCEGSGLEVDCRFDAVFLFGIGVVVHDDSLRDALPEFLTLEETIDVVVVVDGVATVRMV